MATTIEGEERSSEVLARFPRPSRAGGNDEQIRLTVGRYRDKLSVALRLWYAATRPSRDDDGYRPTRQGNAIREHELTPLIDALIKIRERVSAEGRATSPQPLPSRGSAPSPDRREWKSEAGLPHASRRRQVEQPVILKDDATLDAEDANRRQSAPWEG